MCERHRACQHTPYFFYEFHKVVMKLIKKIQCVLWLLLVRRYHYMTGRERFRAAFGRRVPVSVYRHIISFRFVIRFLELISVAFVPVLLSWLYRVLFW